MEQTYQEIADKYKIGADGFNCDRPFVVNEHKLGHIAQLIEYSFGIPAKGSRKHVHSSYALKHFAEKVLGEKVNHYVSNAEMIVAMIERGFKPSTIVGLNSNFKVDIESAFAKGFKEGKSIWKKRITEKNTYDVMEDQDENFRIHYSTECDSGFDPDYDLYLRGYFAAEQQTRMFYPEEYHTQPHSNSNIQVYFSRQYII